LPLTVQEAQAYKHIDSMVENSGLFTKMLLRINQFSPAKGNIRITRFSDFFHFNRVEGAYAGVGFKVKNLFQRNDLIAQVGYGFSNKKSTYLLGFEHFINGKRKTSFGFNVYRRISYRENEEYFMPGEITWLALLNKNDPVDYYEINGWSPYVWLKLSARNSIKFSYIIEKQSSLTKHSDFSLFYPSSRFRLNPPIYDGYSRSMRLVVNYDTRKFIDFGGIEDFDRSLNCFWGEIGFEWSDRKILRSDYCFSQIVGSLNIHYIGFGSRAIDFFLRLGYSIGRIPTQRIFELYAPVSGLCKQFFLRTIGLKEFGGDKFYTLIVERDIINIPFGKLGLPFINNMDLVLFFGSGWSSVLKESTSALPSLMKTCKKLHNEIGFGLSKFLTFLRLDFTWDITGETSKKFAFSVQSSVF